MNHRDMIQAPTRPAAILEDTMTPASMAPWLENLVRIHADTLPPATVQQWLENLIVLSGVPLDYLVPDERMLPGESLRFFQVDPQWIYSLMEGAYSVGRVTTGEVVHDQVLAPCLYKQVAPRLYDHLARQSDTASHDEPDRFVLSGFLLRSTVVSGWPRLRVTAYDVNKGKLNPPRGLESGRRLTPNILLYLFEGILVSLAFQEPSEGLHFGLDKRDAEGVETLTGSKSLRYANVPKARVQQTPPGTAIQDGKNPVTVPLDFRPGRKVLKINEIAQRMAARLPAAQGNNKDDGSSHNFTPAEFALEMIEGVEGVIVHITSGAGG